MDAATARERHPRGAQQEGRRRRRGRAAWPTQVGGRRLLGSAGCAAAAAELRGPAALPATA
eukprot:4891189-Prymnesium_polylepis.1